MGSELCIRDRIGSGAVSLLGNTQNQFEFSNGGAETVTVDILVGRNLS